MVAVDGTWSNRVDWTGWRLTPPPPPPASVSISTTSRACPLPITLHCRVILEEYNRHNPKSGIHHTTEPTIHSLTLSLSVPFNYQLPSRTNTPLKPIPRVASAPPFYQHRLRAAMRSSQSAHPVAASSSFFSTSAFSAIVFAFLHA